MIDLNIFNETDFDVDNEVFLSTLDKGVKILKKSIIEKLGERFKGIINLVFCDDVKIRKHNKMYRNIDKSTDVLSFVYYDDLSENEKIIGDIYISIDTAKKQAHEKNHEISYELKVLFTHGFLHLMGFDHNNDKEEEEMESYAKQIL